MGTLTEIPDEAFMQGVPRIVNVIVDMHGGMSPHDPLIEDFVGFIQGFVLNVHHGISKVYVDDAFLDTLIKNMEAVAVVEFKVNVLWNYKVLLDDTGQHHLELTLHPYNHAELVGYTVQ